MESPVLPCKRKIPARYNDGEDQHNHKDVELLYRQLYYDAYDYVISGIKNRFDQPDFKLYSHMQNLLLKAANGQKYLEEYNIIQPVIATRIYVLHKITIALKFMSYINSDLQIPAKKMQTPG